ncbi:hypothetical protein GCM10023189_40320 [Nibrella saemangeumensis]|uniref:DUF6434 domain-containing protein n=1 Tax=Nibrella saemangeumensis TaxID=1084526 RepID=A0ABP8NBR7_9BACT
MDTKGVRPALTPETSIADFRNFYWYKEELIKFCATHGIPVSGMKHELYERIEEFLRTGKVKKEKLARKIAAATIRTSPLTLDTLVNETYRCNNETRNFFKSVIGAHFHFTAHLQAFLKANRDCGLTYGDLAKEWEAEYERRKDKSYKAPIMKTWEYNQFTRDYLADTSNKGKGIKEAAAAWKKIRANKGPRTYEEFKKLF